VTSRPAAMYTCDTCGRQAEGKSDEGEGPIGWVQVEIWRNGRNVYGDCCTETCVNEWLSHRRSLLMTDETTAPATADEPTEDLGVPTEDSGGSADEADDDDDAPASASDSRARMEERRKQRRLAPRVTIKVAVPTAAESWGPGAQRPGTEHDGDVWNVQYVSRPGLTIQARQMPWDFTFETEDWGREMDGQAGDWLIRYTESGNVFALTDTAFQALFQTAPAAEEPPSDA
jgi:hypothetical protein